jgi:hypothetical protein
MGWHVLADVSQGWKMNIQALGTDSCVNLDYSYTLYSRSAIVRCNRMNLLYPDHHTSISKMHIFFSIVIAIV